MVLSSFNINARQRKGCRLSHAPCRGLRMKHFAASRPVRTVRGLPGCAKGNVGAVVCPQPEDILPPWLYLDQVLLGKAGRSEPWGFLQREEVLSCHFRSPMRTPRGVGTGAPKLSSCFPCCDDIGANFSLVALHLTKFETRQARLSSGPSCSCLVRKVRSGLCAFYAIRRATESPENPCENLFRA